jgi:hypothetical protein
MLTAAPISARLQVPEVTSLKIIAFWDVAPCSLVQTDRKLSNRLHGATSQKTVLILFMNKGNKIQGIKLMVRLGSATDMAAHFSLQLNITYLKDQSQNDNSPLLSMTCENVSRHILE